MRRLTLALGATAAVLTATVMASPARTAEALPRVASTTVCADQMVLALAAPEQIAALSPDAASPWLSLLADRAAGLPLLRPSAEGYLAAGAEVVITNAWSEAQTAALLERFGLTVIRLPLAEDMDSVVASIREVAAVLGQSDRGEALVAAVRQKMAAVEAAPNGGGRLGLYLRPDGGTAAAGSFVATLMDTAGLRNQATEQGLSGWSSYDLERFIAAPPEVIVTSFFESPHRSRNGGFGNHPAFLRRAAALPEAHVPGAYWVCAGWILAEAAERLNRELAP